jgi:class 3 adenylate cyclase
VRQDGDDGPLAQVHGQPVRQEADMGSQTFRIRIGINTGFATWATLAASALNLLAVFEVNLIARLRKSAEAGRILISDETYALVRDFLRSTSSRASCIQGGFATPSTRTLCGLQATGGGAPA